MKPIKAWSVIKTGQYRASSDLWTFSCISKTKTEAITRLRKQTGENWHKLRGAGFEAVKITIAVEVLGIRLDADERERKEQT